MKAFASRILPWHQTAAKSFRRAGRVRFQQHIALRRNLANDADPLGEVLILGRPVAETFLDLHAILVSARRGRHRDKTLRDVLRSDVSLGAAPDALFDLISFLTGGERREKARRLAHGEDPDGDAATLDVLAVLQKFAGVRPHPEAFVEALEPLQPRLYSISSSPKATPGRLSLTVDAVRYVIGKRKRLGVASTFLSERIAAGETLPVYVQAGA